MHIYFNEQHLVGGGDADALRNSEQVLFGQQPLQRVQICPQDLGRGAAQRRQYRQRVQRAPGQRHLQPHTSPTEMDVPSRDLSSQ